MLSILPHELFVKGKWGRLWSFRDKGRVWEPDSDITLHNKVGVFYI